MSMRVDCRALTFCRGSIINGGESAVTPSPMKLKFPAVLCVVAAAVRLSAAEPAGQMLLKANSIAFEGQRSIATDQATLIMKQGDTRLTADKIVYDQSTSTFTLTGRVKIHSGGNTIETSDATINAADQRVLQLTAGQITFSSFSDGVSPIDAGATTSRLPAFSEPMPKTETQLSAPRK